MIWPQLLRTPDGLEGLLWPEPKAQAIHESAMQILNTCDDSTPTEFWKRYYRQVYQYTRRQDREAWKQTHPNLYREIMGD